MKWNEEKRLKKFPNVKDFLVFYSVNSILFKLFMELS